MRDNFSEFARNVRNGEVIMTRSHEKLGLVVIELQEVVLIIMQQASKGLPELKEAHLKLADGIIKDPNLVGMLDVTTKEQDDGEVQVTLEGIL